MMFYVALNCKQPSYINIADHRFNFGLLTSVSHSDFCASLNLFPSVIWPHCMCPSTFINRMITSYEKGYLLLFDALLWLLVTTASELYLLKFWPVRAFFILILTFLVHLCFWNNFSHIGHTEMHHPQCPYHSLRTQQVPMSTHPTC